MRTRLWTRWRLASLDSLRTGTDATVVLLQSLPAASEGGRTLRPRVRLRSAGLRPCLTGLLLQTLAGDADALLLIGIGRAQRTNVRANLADLALVRTGNGQVRLFVHRDLNAI